MLLDNERKHRPNVPYTLHQPIFLPFIIQIMNCFLILPSVQSSQVHNSTCHYRPTMEPWWWCRVPVREGLYLANTVTCLEPVQAKRYNQSATSPSLLTHHLVATFYGPFRGFRLQPPRIRSYQRSLNIIILCLGFSSRNELCILWVKYTKNLWKQGRPLRALGASWSK